jgi:predicted dehydrogenase
MIDAASVFRRLRVGVLGLGQHWRRYRPALQRLPDIYTIDMVCDPVARRAEEEARLLDCPAAAGPTELLENPSIDALLLLDPPWYGLWPIQVACRFAKPVFWVPVLDPGEHGADLVQHVQQHRLPVMAALPLRRAAPTILLQELIAKELGHVRLILCDARQGASSSSSRLLGGTGPALVDWCLAIMGSRPERVQASVNLAGLTSVVLDWGDGRAAQIVQRRMTGAGSRFRLEVVAEHGSAVIQLPGRIEWRNEGGWHGQRLPRQPSLTRQLLLAFHRTMTQGTPPEPNLADAAAALACLRAASQAAAGAQSVAVGN